jgi:hypothetical protein
MVLLVLPRSSAKTRYIVRKYRIMKVTAGTAEFVLQQPVAIVFQTLSGCPLS